VELADGEEESLGGKENKNLYLGVGNLERKVLVSLGGEKRVVDERGVVPGTEPGQV